MSFDPNESIHKAKRREELSRRLDELQKEFQAKRQRMVQAMGALLKVLLGNPGSASGTANPFSRAARRQAVAEALISTCRVAKDTGHDIGIEYIIQQDNDR